MSKDDCKQRFKGVENFLRRVAFNLGNTPSQTEVKVISCIPIDVSDLQQKIIELEKQLETVHCKVTGTSQICNAGFCSTSFPKITNVANSSKAISCYHSNVSLHCPNPPIKSSKTSIVHRPNPCTARGYFSTDVSEMTYSKNQKIEGRKKFFNKKIAPKKKKIRTELVYYTQTEDRNPFNQHGLPYDGTSKNRGNEDSNAFKRSYLSDMVRKQYKPGAVNADFDMSEFSTPICRDFIRAQTLLDLQPHESDMCSCCHGPFRNIDNHMSKHNHCDIFSSQSDSKNTYYDSKFYDVIPVKENSVKIKNTEHPKRKEPKQLNKNTDSTCWPGYVRPRCRDMPPIIVNYNTTAPTRQHITKVPLNTHKRKERVLNKMHKKPVTSAPVNRQVKPNVSKIRSVEVSEVYTRRLVNNRRKIVSKPTPAKGANQRNDVACLTTIIANTECQTASDTNPVLQENKNAEDTNVTASEDKTKVTLNQIKEILQSVLTEVKTNSKIGNILGQAQKKDAVVQNGLSRSNILGGSSLMQTFTYGPYDIDPYGPSCSQQIQTSSLCYPNMPPGSTKCMQHYPLFIQPGRNMCASCYNPKRNNPTIHNLPNMKRAASTATNTEELRARSKETENLIREIYKAMALNIDISTEGTSVKEHGDINKTIRNNNTRTEDNESKHLANAISEIFKNTNPIETSVTQNTSTPYDSKLASNETSFRSQLVVERSYPRDENAKYNNSNARFDSETEQVSRQLESDEESDTTIVNEETESSASETESECDEGNVVLAIEEPVKKKDKKGIFSKMLKILTPRSRKTKSKVVNQPTDGEYVDYRIIHRNKTIAPMSGQKPISSRSRAVVYYSKKPQKQRNQSPELPQKSPYMEQEYRRYFDEQLMFHDAQDPKSSTRGVPPRKKPVYYQKIETRSALVDYNQKVNRQNYPETKSMKQYLNRGNQKFEKYSNTKNVSPERASIVPSKTLRCWLEKHKLGIHCGKQWKKLVLES